MLEFLKRRFNSEKGAMDKILVTLLLVVVAMAAVAGLGGWMKTEVDEMKTEAQIKIDEAKTSNN